MRIPWPPGQDGCRRDGMGQRRRTRERQADHPKGLTDRVKGAEHSTGGQAAFLDSVDAISNSQLSQNNNPQKKKNKKKSRARRLCTILHHQQIPRTRTLQKGPPLGELGTRGQVSYHLYSRESTCMRAARVERINLGQPPKEKIEKKEWVSPRQRSRTPAFSRMRKSACITTGLVRCALVHLAARI